MQLLKVVGEVHVGWSDHSRRRVVLLERRDGRFTFAEEYHYVIEHEGKVEGEGWARLPPDGIFLTADDAERAGRVELEELTRRG